MKNSTMKTFLLSLTILFALPAMAQSDDTDDLPVEVQADLLFTEAKVHMDAEEWPAAANVLERMKGLKTDLGLEFSYHYGNTLAKAGRPIEANLELVSYMARSIGRSAVRDDAGFGIQVFLRFGHTSQSPEMFRFALHPQSSPASPGLSNPLPL